MGLIGTKQERTNLLNIQGEQNEQLTYHMYRVAIDKCDNEKAKLWSDDGSRCTVPTTLPGYEHLTKHLNTLLFKRINGEFVEIINPRNLTIVVTGEVRMITNANQLLLNNMDVDCKEYPQLNDYFKNCMLVAKKVPMSTEFNCYFDVSDECLHVIQ